MFLIRSKMTRNTGIPLELLEVENSLTRSQCFPQCLCVYLAFGPPFAGCWMLYMLT